MNIVFYTLSLVIVIAIAVYKYLTWHYNLWKKIGLPGPKPKLLFGNFPSYITGKQHVAYDMDTVYKAYKGEHRAIGVFVMREPEILLLDPNLAHRMMVTDFRKFRDNLSSKWILNPKADKYSARNPFFSTADDWKTRRAECLAGLTQNKLQHAYPIWKSSAQKLSRFLDWKTSHNNSTEIETKDLAFRFTVNVMGDFLWGIDAGTFAVDSSTSATDSNAIMEMSVKMLAQSFRAIIFYFITHAVPFVRRFFNTRFYPRQTDDFFSQLTKDAIAMRLKTDGGNVQSRTDFLNYVMQLQEKKQLSHDDVVGHILTAMLDGYETSATVISHTLFYLAHHQQVQEKLRTEIQTNLESDGFMTFENLNALPYLDQCVYETLRMITPLPMFSRICTEPIELELEDRDGCGAAGDRHLSIEVGTIVNVPIFSFHHDPEYFPQPYEYNPDRFDNAAHIELTKQGIFMPFGDGPRICLGMRMGLLEVKTCIVEILKAYRIKCGSRTMMEKKPDAMSFIFGLAGDFWLEYEHL